MKTVRRESKKKRKKKGAASAGKTPPTVYLPTHEALAEYFHLELKTMSRWQREGAPKRTKRGYNLRAWVVWRIKTREGSNGRAVEDPEITEADKRRRMAQADNEEIKRETARIELEATKKKLIAVDVADARVKSQINICLSILNRIALDLAPRVAGKGLKDAGKIIKEFIDERREEVSKDGRRRK